MGMAPVTARVVTTRVTQNDYKDNILTHFYQNRGCVGVAVCPQDVYNDVQLRESWIRNLKTRLRGYQTWIIWCNKSYLPTFNTSSHTAVIGIRATPR